MPDDLTKKGPQDDRGINVQQPHELHYWSNQLGVTPEQLRLAVTNVGPMVRDVRRALGK